MWRNLSYVWTHFFIWIALCFLLKRQSILDVIELRGLFTIINWTGNLAFFPCFLNTDTANLSMSLWVLSQCVQHSGKLYCFQLNNVFVKWQHRNVERFCCREFVYFPFRWIVGQFLLRFVTFFFFLHATKNRHFFNPWSNHEWLDEWHWTGKLEKNKFVLLRIMWKCFPFIVPDTRQTKPFITSIILEMEKKRSNPINLC